MMLATYIFFLGALTCLLHQSSAQQNWWEKGPDGSTTIATSRATTAEPTRTPAPPPPVSTNCPCATTPEYNPVCGDDGQTYDNPGMLECAQNCGTRVQLLFHGRCKKVR